MKLFFIRGLFITNNPGPIGSKTSGTPRVFQNTAASYKKLKELRKRII